MLGADHYDRGVRARCKSQLLELPTERGGIAEVKDVTTGTERDRILIRMASGETMEAFGRCVAKTFICKLQMPFDSEDGRLMECT